MGCIRPATPGFLVTLIATGLLAVVSFCVPFFKSVYFLKADISVGDVKGFITFGTLGYCQQFQDGNEFCSKPSIGYELDINGLVDNNLPIEIPQVAVKWITYALFSHVVALALSAGSAVFGLLAHVREMSMTYCSICISGFAASVALIAFIFDVVLFFVAKSRINAVGSASIGNALWLTLAAWVLLFFSGCFYGVGRCCIRKRPKMGGSGWGEGSGRDPRFDNNKNDYAEQMRLDAVKAEADRKARERQQKEVGLPAFSETQPLTARVDGDHVYLDDDPPKDNAPPSPSLSRPSQTSLTSNRSNRRQYAAGYVQGTPGNRAIDDYYNTGSTNTPAPNTYPPQPHRQASASATAYAPTGYSNAAAGYSSPQRQPSGYTPSSTPYAQTGYGAYQSTSPPPMPSQSLAVPGQPIGGGYSDPYDPYNQSGQHYGHTAGGSSYHTAASHNQQPSGFSAYDPYPQTTSPPPQNYYSPQPHNQYTEHPTFLATAASSPPSNNASNYPSALQPSYGGAAALTSSPPPAQGGVHPSNSMHSVSSAYHQPQQQQRQYMVGGDAYSNETFANPYDGYSDGYSSQPGSLETGLATTYGGAQSSPVKGPRPQPSNQPATIPEEAPPGYEQGGSNVQGNWGKR